MPNFYSVKFIWKQDSSIKNENMTKVWTFYANQLLYKFAVEVQTKEGGISSTSRN